MRRLKALWGETVWGNTHQRPGDLTIRRVYLPIIYGLYVALGLLAVVYGVPALDDTFDAVFVDWYGIWQFGLAGICFVGYVIPRITVLETVGLALLIGQVVCYAASLIGLATAGDPTRAYVSVLALIALLPLIIRAALIANEYQVRRIVRALDRGDDD